jgi:hypothetical protein
MRYIKKYKNLFNSSLFLKSFPNKRIFKFNRPKWLKLKFLLKKKKKFIFNFFLIKASYKYWERLQLKYKEGLILKRAVSYFYDNSFNIKIFFKNSSFHKDLLDLLVFLIIKPLCKLEILLWKLNFFNSVYEVKQAIKNKKIFLNSFPVKSNKSLKQGDIIYITNFKKKFITSNFFLFFSFIEVDHYTNTIVLLKNPVEATQQDFYFLLTDYFYYKMLIDFLKK